MARRQNRLWHNVYIPTSAANIVPKRSGNPTFIGNEYPNDPMPNLIRRSVYPDALM